MEAGSVFVGFAGEAVVVPVAGLPEACGVASAGAAGKAFGVTSAGPGGTFWVAGADLGFFFSGLSFSSLIGLDGAGLVFAAVALSEGERLRASTCSGVALDSKCLSSWSISFCAGPV